MTTVMFCDEAHQNGNINELILLKSKINLMFQYEIDTMSRRELAVDHLCQTIEKEYHRDINKSCEVISRYFDTYPSIKGAALSVSEIAYITFDRLKEEIYRHFTNEIEIVFPSIQNCPERHSVLNDTLVIFLRDTHNLIRTNVQKLRELLCDNVAPSKRSTEFKDCINELFSLENKIYKWIDLEEKLLFSKVKGGVPKAY
jgi:iron-sulfur cluster repair protein YtfE (RIC family)